MPALATHLAAACCLISLSGALVLQDSPVCKRKLSSCSCETTTGGKIDLSPLARAGDFAFSGQGPKEPYNYLFNPCIGVKCDTSTGDAASCQRSFDGKYEYLLGTQSSAEFDTQPDVGLHLTVTGLSGDKARRSALVVLVCSTGADHFMALDDGSVGPQPYVYRMRLESKHCCEQSGGGGGGDGGGGGGLSGGDILLIVFFCLLVVYLAGGVAFNVFVRSQRGFPDAVPNREFWSALPGLVRDGAVFAFNGVRAAVSGQRRQQYENI